MCDTVDDGFVVTLGTHLCDRSSKADPSKKRIILTVSVSDNSFNTLVLCVAASVGLALLLAEGS